MPLLMAISESRSIQFAGASPSDDDSARVPVTIDHNEGVQLTFGVVGEKVACGKCFDRCYPSVIAFAEAKEAFAYSQGHGGDIVSFETLAREVTKP